VNFLAIDRPFLSQRIEVYVVIENAIGPAFVLNPKLAHVLRRQIGKSKGVAITRNPLIFLAPRPGLEPGTYGLTVCGHRHMSRQCNRNGTKLGRAESSSATAAWRS
jgi:hypothetical protein